MPSLVHADDAADAPLAVEVQLLRRRHVVGLAERDVELAVRPDVADAGGVVEALLVGRDQLALRHHLADRDVGALVEELGGREDQHPVLLDDVEHAVRAEADAVRNGERERRREVLHLVGDAVLVAVGHRPDLVLARADEGDDALRADRHVPRVRHDRVKLDLEAVGHLDPLERLADPLGIVAVLWICGTPRPSGGMFCRRSILSGISADCPMAPVALKDNAAAVVRSLMHSSLWLHSFSARVAAPSHDIQEKSWRWVSRRARRRSRDRDALAPPRLDLVDGVEARPRRADHRLAQDHPLDPTWMARDRVAVDEGVLLPGVADQHEGQARVGGEDRVDRRRPCGRLCPGVPARPRSRRNIGPCTRPARAKTVSRKWCRFHGLDET